MSSSSRRRGCIYRNRCCILDDSGVRKRKFSRNLRRGFLPTMVQSLFPNFLNDLDEYHQVEALWRERWDELVRGVGQERQWVTPWLTTTFANGTPFADGNPIFSAVAPNRRLGVRVIQVEPSEEPRELSFWTDTFAEGEP